MTMTLMEEPAQRASTTPAERLRLNSTAVRVSFTWLGVRKTLTPEQKSQAAEPFDAQGDYLTACKKLLDTKHPAYKDVTAVRGKVRAHWIGCTLPFPESGVRLIRQAQLEAFHDQMTEFRRELEVAVGKLDEHYDELKAAARRRLGKLYDPADYPSRLQGLFALDWDYPAVEPPDYLLQLSPTIYEQERSRVAGRFEEAVRLAEQAFISELAKLVTHLTERLTGTENGERKIYRDSAITNLTEFFERFRQLNVRSNADLDELAEQAQRAIRDVEPQHLRDSESLSRVVATQLSAVAASLDGMMIDRPRRRIIRNQQEHA